MKCLEVKSHCYCRSQQDFQAPRASAAAILSEGMNPNLTPDTFFLHVNEAQIPESCCRYIQLADCSPLGALTGS